jgi:hypothetical protein
MAADKMDLRAALVQYISQGQAAHEMAGTYLVRSINADGYIHQVRLKVGAVNEGSLHRARLRIITITPNNGFRASKYT